MSVSGKFLTAKIGTAVIVGNYAWTVKESVEKLDAITAADAGANRKDFGVEEAQITIKLLVDVTTVKYEPLAAGTEVTSLKLYRVATDAQPAFSFPLARVFDSDQGGELRGRFEMSAQLENVGAYTRFEPGAV